MDYNLNWYLKQNYYQTNINKIHFKKSEYRKMNLYDSVTKIVKNSLCMYVYKECIPNLVY